MAGGRLFRRYTGATAHEKAPAIARASPPSARRNATGGVDLRGLQPSQLGRYLGNRLAVRQLRQLDNLDSMLVIAERRQNAGRSRDTDDGRIEIALLRDLLR